MHTQLTALALTVAAAAALTACGTASGSDTSAAGTSGATGTVAGLPACPDDLPGPVALSVGRRANSPDQAALPTAAAAVLDKAIDGHRQITVIEADGRPTKVTAAAFTPDAKSDTQREKMRAQFVSGLRRTLTSLKPAAAEAAPLQALQLAGRVVAGQNGTVVLADNLLSTVAPLDYTRPGMWSAAPSDVVTQLTRSGELPDLTGTALILVGAGDTAGGQQPLSQPARAGLLQVWGAIAAAGKARCVTVATAPNNAKAIDASVPVSTVTPPASARLQLPSGTTPAVTTLADDATYGFTEGTADLRDPKAAAAGLKDLATWMTGHPAGRITLTGTTARWGSKEYQIDLATRRAAAIRGVLTGLGAPADRITTSGVGSWWPGYTPDTAADGSLLPIPAATNRSVIVTASAG